MKTFIFSLFLLIICVSCSNDDMLEKKTNSYDLYVAGIENNEACYWKNAVKTTLSGGTNYRAREIFIDNNDIYISAYYQNPVSFEVNYYYWKNNIKYDIAQSLGILANMPNQTNFRMSNFFLKNGDLYIAGLIKNPFPTSNQNLYQYCYWKNGTKTVVFEQQEDQTSAVLYILGNDIYIPLEKNIVNTPSPNWEMGYYKNGVYHFVNNLSNCINIIEDNGNVLMQVNDQSNNTGYYKNLSTGTTIPLPAIIAQNNINSILYDGSNKYYVGTQYYFKNNIQYNLYSPGSDFKTLRDFKVLDDNVYKILHKDHLGVDDKVYINDIEVQTTANTLNNIEEEFFSLAVVPH